MTSEIELSTEDLRAVTAFAAGCAETVLAIFEADRPDDTRPRDALGAAWEFARGGARGKALRDTAFAALKAAKDVDTEAAGEAARAAMSAAGAAYLHPLAKATQVKHILGAAAYAARAAELVDPTAGAAHVEQGAPRDPGCGRRAQALSGGRGRRWSGRRPDPPAGRRTPALRRRHRCRGFSPMGAARSAVVESGA